MVRQVTRGVIAVALIVWANLATAEVSTLEYIDSISPPPLMSGVGNSHLEITTKSEQAQRFFDQGVSLQHDFWWFEAYRSFLHASQLDPDSPMPHWGLYEAGAAIANLSRVEREQVLDDAVESMKRLRENASEREHYYLDAAIDRHAAGDDREAANAAYSAQLVALLEKYPDEIEARLFLWLALETGFNADGSPKVEQLYGQLLLEREFEGHADHQGLLHYWIHSQEPGPSPASALDAARRLADLAPNAGHIVHMPGHIHYLIGNYDQAHLQFKKAENADARYMSTYKIEPIFAWNYLHNFSFMMSNLAEAGRVAEGAEYGELLAEMTESSSFKYLPHYGMLLSRAVMERAYMAIRVEGFPDAAALLDDSRWDGAEKSPGLEATQAAYRAYAAGMAAAHAGEAPTAEARSRELDSILWRAARDEVSLGYRKLPLEIAALELQGLVAHSKGDNAEAIKQLERAVALESEIEYGEPRPNIHPAAESLATVQLAEKNWDAARDAYESLLKTRPSAGMALFGIARSHELEGNAKQARKAYETFVNAWQSADSDLPQLRHARSWLAQ